MSDDRRPWETNETASEDLLLNARDFEALIAEHGDRFDEYPIQSVLATVDVLFDRLRDLYDQAFERYMSTDVLAAAADAACIVQTFEFGEKVETRGDDPKYGVVTGIASDKFGPLWVTVRFEGEPEDQRVDPQAIRSRER